MTEYDDPIVAEIQNAAPFSVDVVCEGYPDVFFNIILAKQPDECMILKSVAALQAYMYTYNKKHIFRPIHYVSDAEDLPDATFHSSFCVHVDFGNANPKALVGAVKALAETDLPIRCLILE